MFHTIKVTEAQRGMYDNRGWKIVNVTVMTEGPATGKVRIQYIPKQQNRTIRNMFYTVKQSIKVRGMFFAGLTIEYVD